MMDRTYLVLDVDTCDGLSVRQAGERAESGPTLGRPNSTSTARGRDLVEALFDLAVAVLFAYLTYLVLHNAKN